MSRIVNTVLNTWSQPFLAISKLVKFCCSRESNYNPTGFSIGSSTPSSKLTLLALEPRFMFDGVAIVDPPVPQADIAENNQTPAADCPDTEPVAVPIVNTDVSRPELPLQTFQVKQESETASLTTPILSVSVAPNASTAVGSPHSVLIIDGRVPDAQAIINAAAPDVKIITLDTQQDGIKQIATALQGMQNLDSISIISHGDKGLLLLGNSPLFNGNLANYNAELQTIGQALNADGDILLYGCEVGAGSEGQSFLEALSEATGADIAASIDDTGGITQGGNWELEITTGDISDLNVLNQTQLTHYDNLLVTSSVSTVAQLKAAIATGNTDGVADTITLTSNITFASAADAITINVTDGQTMSIVGGGFTLSGNNLARVLDVSTSGGSNVAISNLTISNGFLTGAGGNTPGNSAGLAGGDALGANIRNTGTLTISGSSITDGKAAGGGGGGGGAAGGGGAGGGGGGFGTTSGGAGGSNPTHSAGAASAGTGGDGAGFGNLVGRGGSTTGGAGANYGSGYTNGGTGGTASNGSISIGGGGGGGGYHYAGGRGGNAAGGIYNTGILTITTSSITNNIGAGGGGGGGGAAGISGNGGDAGSGIGAIWNAGGTVQIDSTTNTSLATGNVGAAGGVGSTLHGGSSNGAAGNATSQIRTTSGGTTDTNYTVPPSITSASYNASTGVLVVTAADMQALAGANNDIDASRLTLTGEGGATYTLTDTADVEISSATSFTLTLSATDRAAYNLIANKNGTSSTTGATYNLAAADDWNAAVTSGTSSDATSAVTVSNVAVPTITSSTYNVSTGVLTVTGTNFLSRSGATNDIDITKLTLTGEGGATRTLTSSNVEITNGTGFSVTLNGADQAAINLFLNKNGTSSTGGTTYNLAAAEDWAAGADSAVVTADLTGNGVTVSNVAVPALTSATYNASTGVLVVTGTGFVSASGASNDIDISKLTLTGEGGVTRTLTTPNVDITSATSFSVTLNSADQAATNLFMNKNGTSSTSSTTYNLSAAEDWASGADAAVVTADLTGNGVTVSNVAAPTITSATYDASTGILTVTGTGFLSRSGAANDIDLSKLSLSGDSSAYTLTTGSVEVANNTSFSVTLNGTDVAALTSRLNKNGTSSAGSVTYNLAAAEDWAAGADSAVVVADTTGNGVTVNNVSPTVNIVVADTTLAAGETSAVTFTFSEAVTGFTIADITIPNASLSPVSSGDGGVTWTATLTPTDSITDTTNVITVDKTGVTSISTATAGIGTTDSNNYAIDTVRPSASIVVADSSLIAGETSVVTFTFNEAVFGFTNADLTVPNGVLTGVSSTDSITWTASFTPTVSITDATNLIVLNNTGLTDSVGNTGTGTTDSNNYAIDTVRPTATIVVADTALRVGETSSVSITFSEAVTGFTNADLSVTNGTLSSVSSSDGGITWTASLTPTDNLTDATNVISLANTGVTDISGNTGTGTTNSNNYSIDTTRPTAAIVVSDTSLIVGETSLVTITFNEAVTGLTTADFIAANGVLNGLTTGDGGITWTATFTPTVNITDFTNLIALDNTGLVDLVGNAGTGTTDSNNYAIDTARPTATIVVADNALAAGETSAVTITFNEAVTGFTNADLAIANGTLSIVSTVDSGITWTATLTPSPVTDATNVITLDNTGVQDALGNTGINTTDSNNYAIDLTSPTAMIVVTDTVLSATETSLVTITFNEAVTGLTTDDFTVNNGTLTGLTSTDGGVTWTATLAPNANVSDTTNLISLDNTGLTDLAGNPGLGITNSNNYIFDTERPTATIALSDTDLSVGETATLTITFSEAVTGLTVADFTVTNATLSGLTSNDGGITWIGLLTPKTNITASTNAIALDNTGITDAAGNTGTGITASTNYVINTKTPAPPTSPGRTQSNIGALILLSNQTPPLFPFMASEPRFIAPVNEFNPKLAIDSHSGPQNINLNIASLEPDLYLKKLFSDQILTERKSFNFSVPPESFGYWAYRQGLKFSATQADGSPLPYWLHFDPKKLTFTGVPPKNANDIEVMITVKDKNVNAAHRIFKIIVDEEKTAADKKVQRHSDNKFINRDLGFAFFPDSEFALAGKPGFTDQLKNAGRFSRMAESKALLDSLSRL